MIQVSIQILSKTTSRFALVFAKNTPNTFFDDYFSHIYLVLSRTVLKTSQQLDQARQQGHLRAFAHLFLLLQNCRTDTSYSLAPKLLLVAVLLYSTIIEIGAQRPQRSLFAQPNIDNLQDRKLGSGNSVLGQVQA